MFACFNFLSSSLLLSVLQYPMMTICRAIFTPGPGGIRKDEAVFILYDVYFHASWSAMRQYLIDSHLQFKTILPTWQHLNFQCSKASFSPVCR